MDHIKETFDSFFRYKDGKVIILKGNWGVGKTHYWRNYVDDHLKCEKKNELGLEFYSYVSLFGKNNLEDIKKEIFIMQLI